MAVVTRIEGVERVMARLKQLAHTYIESPSGVPGSVIVGYAGVNYALYVHEIQATHKPGKQWKYLEEPARNLNNNGQLGMVVAQAMRGGIKMETALAIAGLRIQGASQKVVPVKTGNLKGSAFTRKEL